MPSLLITRLADLGVQAEVRNERTRRVKAGNVTDRCHQRDRHARTDTRDTHQPLGILRTGRPLGELLVDLGDLAVQELDLAQTASDCL